MFRLNPPLFVFQVDLPHQKNQELCRQDDAMKKFYSTFENKKQSDLIHTRTPPDGSSIYR